MKKFIFYAIKSVPEYCHTFSCRCHAGFSSFIRTNVVSKKLVSFGALLLLVFAQATAYGQLVGSSAVKGNFGIEGDVYANWLQFPNILDPNNPVPLTDANTDDWFVNTELYPGTGRGVIDQSMPYPIIDNTAFERRQSITTPTAPFPYPVVPAVGPPWTGSYLWLDAVYGRDTYVKGGGTETSYFAGSGDKNSDNPSTWSIGFSGSVPQKDDIIDVYAHLRGEGIRIPDADPKPFTTLWAYAAASVAVTNGNKHIDFEFFRTEVTLANLGTPGSTGTDGGRTAWTFNPDGSVAIPGTIIISVDYTNGGTVPQVRIRVWMDETVFNNYNNSAPLRPFTIDKVTAFEKGTDSGTYGYAAILENVGATDIWGRVNDTDPTQGPPWGTFAGVGPDGTPNYQELQFIEIGINLTAFGLDARGTQDPCSNILGSLMVKTRSSGGGPNEGAFGSELKDFAGPFLFGNTGNPPEPTVTNKNACENAATGSATVNLTTGANADGGTLSYYTTFTNNVYSGLIATPAAFSAPIGVTTIYARSESLSNPGCFGATSFTVTVTDNPDITVQNLTACEIGTTGAASMDLTSAILTNPDGGMITFHNSLADAQNEANAVASPTSVTVATSPRTFYVRAEAGTTNCYSTASFTVTVTDNPDITVQNLTACEIGTTGAASVALTGAILTNPDGGVITFYNSLADAQNEANAVASPTSVTVASSPRTFHVRAEAGTTNCYSTASFTVTVTDNPDITVQNLTACEIGTTGAASMDLTGGILTNPDGGVITFYNSLADAQNEANAVASPTSVTVASSPRTFYVRAEAGTTNCYSTASFTVTVTDNPDITVQNLTACEIGTTGAASVALTGAILTNPDGGVITFYNSLADAQNEVNAVASPTSVTVASSPRTFYVRAEAGTTNCYSTASFTVTVTDNPDITVQNLTACEIGTTGAASMDLTGGILTNPDGGVITFYNSLADAQNEANAVASPTSVTVASSPRTFYVRAEAGTTNCYSTASFTVTVTDNPDITVQNLAACEIGTTGAASVDLTGGILTNPDGGVITFHNSLADAQNEVNAVASPTSVTVASSPRTFYVRAEAGTTNCYSTASFTVTITDEPDITVQNLTACEIGTTGAASVALTGAILTNPDGGLITFHNSLADAQNDANAVASPTSVTIASSPRTFWVRAEAGTCYSTASFTVTVTDNPDITVQNLTACEIGTTGAASVVLTGGILTNPDGGVITFYNSLADAQNEVNAVASPTSVTVASSPRTFYVRAEAGTTNCYSTASFTVTVTDNPDITVQNLAACEIGTTGAASVDLTGGILTNPDGGVITFYNSLADAQNEVNAVASPTSVTVASSPRTFYVRAEAGTTNCYSTASFTVTVTDNPDITVQNLTACEIGTTGAASVDLTGGILTNPDGGVITFYNSLADAQNEVNAVASPTSVTVASSPRTFYVRAEAGTTNCYSTASFTVTVTDNPDVTTTNLDSCESGSTGAATFDLDNGVTGADGGTISFHTSEADANAGSNPIAGKDAYSASNGVTTIWARSANGSCFGINSFTITVNPNPELTIHNPETVCEGETVDLTAAAITFGSTLEGGSLSYWADAAATMPLATPSAVMSGTYYIKALTEAGCMDIEPVMVTDQPCGGALCTYTQGYYGNLGGMSCADGEQFTTLGLIEKALLSYGGTMQIGLPGKSVLISNTVEDKNAIIAVLPGGGNSYVLLAGDPHINALPSSYLKKGNINNTLLAQTITLGLNLGIDSELGDFVLQSGTLATAAPQGGCGFDTPMPRSCSEEGYTPVINEYEYFTIPAVVDLLPVKTVQGLFDMANYALGGGDLSLYPGITLSALASAVDVINNAFDGCRISMGYDQTPLACLTSSPQDFVAFEVPIVNNTLTVKYKFSYVSDVLIEVFDTNYNKVCSLTDSNSYLDKEIVLNCNFNTGTQKVYIVRLTTRLGHDEKKVMSSY